MTQLLSDDGSLPGAEWVELAEKGQLTDWFSQVNPLEFDAELRFMKKNAFKADKS